MLFFKLGYKEILVLFGVVILLFCFLFWGKESCDGVSDLYDKEFEGGF